MTTRRNILILPPLLVVELAEGEDAVPTLDAEEEEDVTVQVPIQIKTVELILSGSPRHHPMHKRTSQRQLVKQHTGGALTTSTGALTKQRNGV